LTVEAWIAKAQLKVGEFLFPSRDQQSPHIGTRQYARIVNGWVDVIGLDNAAFGTHSMRRASLATDAIIAVSAIVHIIGRFRCARSHLCCW